MRSFLFLVPLLALAGCVVPVEPSAVTPDPDACKASQYQGLVGQPQALLKEMTFPAGTRIIGPGDPVTMDFRAERLNFEIGANGRIDKIACY